MMTFLGIILWWSIGIAPMVYFSWEGRNAFTWGTLATCLVIGIWGPALWILIGFVLLKQSGFWSTPVFGRSKKSGV